MGKPDITGVQLMTADRVPGNVHSALIGLLRDLPAPGPWDAEKKAQFLEAFTKIFDFIYPEENVNK